MQNLSLQGDFQVLIKSRNQSRVNILILAEKDLKEVNTIVHHPLKYRFLF